VCADCCSCRRREGPTLVGKGNIVVTGDVLRERKRRNTRLVRDGSDAFQVGDASRVHDGDILVRNPDAVLVSDVDRDRQVLISSCCLRSRCELPAVTTGYTLAVRSHRHRSGVINRAAVVGDGEGVVSRDCAADTHRSHASVVRRRGYSVESADPAVIRNLDRLTDHRVASRILGGDFDGRRRVAVNSRLRSNRPTIATDDALAMWSDFHGGSIGDLAAIISDRERIIAGSRLCKCDCCNAIGVRFRRLGRISDLTVGSDGERLTDDGVPVLIRRGDGDTSSVVTHLCCGDCDFSAGAPAHSRGIVRDSDSHRPSDGFTWEVCGVAEGIVRERDLVIAGARLTEFELRDTRAIGRCGRGGHKSTEAVGCGDNNRFIRKQVPELIRHVQFDNASLSSSRFGRSDC